MASQIDTLIVHIGDIKSGTTSVQVALAAGCIPPTIGPVVYPTTSLNHNHLERPLGLEDGLDHPSIQRLRAQIMAAGPDSVCILSGERLSMLPARRLKAGLTRCFGDLARRMLVVHYIRPHAQRMLSAYAEMIKTGVINQPLEPWIEGMLTKPRYLHARRIAAHRAAFGPDYVLRCMLPGQLTRNDVVVDFYQHVLGQVPDDWQPPQPANEAMSAAGLAQVARFQARLDGQDPGLRHAMGYEFARRYSRDGHGADSGRPGMTEAMAARCRALFAPDALALDQALFGGAPQFAKALDHGLARAVRDIAAPLDLPADGRGARVSRFLLGRLEKAEDPAQLKQQLRRARIRRFMAEARSQGGAQDGTRDDSDSDGDLD